MTKTIEQRLQAIEDREEIIKLKARYVNYNDGGWAGPTHRAPEAIADMFVEDGVWDGSPHVGRAEGRKAITELFRAFGAVPFIIHYVTNPLIEVDGDRATGHWHVLVTSTLPDGTAGWTLGIYEDEYVRTAEGWKFKTLRFTAAANTPYDVGWGKARYGLGQERS